MSPPSGHQQQQEQQQEQQEQEQEQEQEQQHDMNEVIHLNVGGRRYSTTRSTLCRDPHSMLAAMFGGAFTPGHRDSSDSSVFIDRDGDVFCHVLNYLRTMKLDLPDDFNDHARLLTEAEYFGLHQLQDLLCSRSRRLSKKRYVELWSMESAPESLEQFYHPHYVKTKTVMRISGPEALIRRLELNCSCQQLKVTPRLMDNFKVMRLELPTNDFKLRYLAELSSMGCKLVSHSSSMCSEAGLYRNFEQYVFEFAFIDPSGQQADACSCSQPPAPLLQEKTIPILMD